jgi:SAM-dependent methyltransferase
VSGSPAMRKRRGAFREPHVALTNTLTDALLYDSRFSRLLRRPVWNRMYSACCRDFLAKGVMNFLNLGYLADSSELGGEDVDDIADRVSERLYRQIVGDTDLKGRTAIEVGCGPGGGSAFMASTYGPASFTGIDLNKSMIAWCREHHDVHNLQFRQGDAQDLPIESSSVDAVINVESSHCYPSRLRFFEEVVRVLRPGGAFLFTDLVVCDGDQEGPSAVSALLTEAGMVIEDCIDITRNVLAARDAVSRSAPFLSRMRENVPSLMLPVAEDALNLSGTRFYNRLASGQTLYIQWKASKPAPSSVGAVVAETAGDIAG